MTKLGKTFIFGFAFVVAFGLIIGNTTVAVAEDAMLIKIHGVGDESLAGIFIDPETAYVKKDTVVVWLSGVKDQEVKVEFADGKKCKSVTAHSMGFNLEKERWCYVTSYVPFAATSSLQFVDVGEYDYKVITKDGKITATGKIVVD